MAIIANKGIMSHEVQPMFLTQGDCATGEYFGPFCRDLRKNECKN